MDSFGSALMRVGDGTFRDCSREVSWGVPWDRRNSHIADRLATGSQPASWGTACHTSSRLGALSNSDATFGLPSHVAEAARRENPSSTAGGTARRVRRLRIHALRLRVVAVGMAIFVVAWVDIFVQLTTVPRSRAGEGARRRSQVKPPIQARRPTGPSARAWRWVASTGRGGRPAILEGGRRETRDPPGQTSRRSRSTSRRRAQHGRRRRLTPRQHRAMHRPHAPATRRMR